MAAPKGLTAIPVLALALYVGGCKESTAPAADPAAIAAAVNGVMNGFSQNTGFQSLGALAGNVTFPSAVARAPAVFPGNLLGLTYVWDSTRGHYIAGDTINYPRLSRDRVRFVLYVVDAATHRPVSGYQKVGSVDLIFLGGQTTTSIRVLEQLVPTLGSVTVADYIVTEAATTDSLTFTTAGYVTDVLGTGVKYTLTLKNAFSRTDSGAVTDYEVSASNGTSVVLRSFGHSSGSNVRPSVDSLDWLAQRNGSVEVVGRQWADSGNVQFKLNGTTWATVHGPGGTVPTGPNGRALSAAELVAIAQILSGFLSIYGSVFSVFVPALLVLI